MSTSGVLFKIILCLLFLPMIQQMTGVFKVNNLGGYVSSVKNIEFNFDNWLDGSFQSGKEHYLKSNFGFRNFFVRLQHQWSFSLFNKSPLSHVYIGKSNHLFSKSYIDTELGADFIGSDKIKEYALKFKQINDSLDADGKLLIFITAPSKASYHKEFLSKEQQKQLKQTKNTNYKQWKKSIEKTGITHIDLNEWFIKNKNINQIPLFPKTGVHYTRFASALAMQIITDSLEKRMDVDLPDIIITDTTWSEKPRFQDDDTEKAMNLLFEIDNFRYAYPQLYFEKMNKAKKDAIFIGDSFLNQFMYLHYFENVFENGDYWYYNKEKFPEKIKINNQYLEQKIYDTDIIAFMFTPQNFEKHLFEIIDFYHNYFFDKINFNKHEFRILEMIKSIKNNPEWLESIKAQAKEKRKPLDELIRKNAEWMVNKLISEGK